MKTQTNFYTKPKTMQDKGYKTLIDGQLTINAQELKRALKNAIKCCTFNSTGSLIRDFENHVYFDFGNKGYLTIMGTNGHSLYYYKIECSEEWHNKFYFSYHRRDVAKQVSVLTPFKGNVTMTIRCFEKGSKNRSFFKTSYCAVSTDYTDDKERHMPDYLSVISKEWNRELNIHDRQAFAKQLKEECKKNKHLKLAFLLNKKGTKLKRVKSFTIDMRTTFEMPQHTFKGEPLDIGFNPEYFLKILEAYKEGLCQIQFYNEYRAFGEINPHEVYIMMPIMLGWGDDEDEDNDQQKEN